MRDASVQQIHPLPTHSDRHITRGAPPASMITDIGSFSSDTQADGMLFGFSTLAPSRWAASGMTLSPGFFKRFAK